MSNHKRTTDEIIEGTHSDPKFYAKYEFCRTDCEECDRLDRIELDAGMTKQEARDLGAAKVMAAARDQGFLLPEGITWEEVVARTCDEAGWPR